MEILKRLEEVADILTRRLTPQQTNPTQAFTPHLHQNQQTLTMQQSSSTPFCVPFGRTLNNPTVASPTVHILPYSSTSASASREGNIQKSLVQLFKPYDFICLAETGAVTFPSKDEKCSLQRAGLGRKTITFPDNKAKYLAFEQAL